MSFLQNVYEHDGKHQPPPTPAPLAVAGPGEDTPYGLAALMAECRDIAVMPPDSGRNVALNDAAYAMGQLIGSGHLTEATARRQLEVAARACGLPEKEIRLVLRDDGTGGLAAGRRTPRQVPKRADPGATEPATATSVSGSDGASDSTGTFVPVASVDPIRARLRPGAAFILDTPNHIPAIWGEGTTIAWAEGEALMLNGPAGVGKTTLAAQLIRARLGLDTTVLGLPVTPGRRVLYLAMDRPRQIARAHRRIYNDTDRDVLQDRLVVWEGPPPYDLAKRPETLTEMAEAAGADTIVVDSLKDAAIGLTDDEVGASYNRARQAALVAGVQVLELHHQRKASAGNAKPNSLDDVYGSTWLTAGAGSVILLWGTPGDAIVELSHLKQPAEPIGPMRVIHDHHTGRSDIYHSTDLLALAIANQGRLTARLTAIAMFETDKPDRNQVEKARRKLEALVRAGHLTVTGEGARGGTPGTGGTTYGAARHAA
ncbi:hypothetical protein GCM10009547_48590 [Sporichthya brevicatena]|uniref:AAA+ ATPase domain-containing protein n=1 Tax=Sporichthya brevicatena TaxID=171442 RepID=A0ABP3SKL8_9ACTN